MKYIRIIFFVLLIGISFIYAEWPLPNESNQYISDIFSSWRGSSYWHTAIDIPVWNKGYDIKNINVGIIEWVDVTSNYYNYIVVGDSANISYNYGHVTSFPQGTLYHPLPTKYVSIGYIDYKAQYPELPPKSSTT